MASASTEQDRHFPYPGVLVGSEPFDRRRQGDLVEPGSDLFQEDPDLEAGKCGTEAEMPPVSECEMRVRIAPDIEAERINEYGFVAVRRSPPDGHLVARIDRAA